MIASLPQDRGGWSLHLVVLDDPTEGINALRLAQLHDALVLVLDLCNHIHRVDTCTRRLPQGSFGNSLYGSPSPCTQLSCCSEDKVVDEKDNHRQDAFRRISEGSSVGSSVYT